MRDPSVVGKRGDRCACRDGRSPVQRRVGPMRVIEGLECRQLPFQVRRGPEQHPIRTFSAQGADQPFDERMGQRHVGRRDLGAARAAPSRQRSARGSRSVSLRPGRRKGAKAMTAIWGGWGYPFSRNELRGMRSDARDEVLMGTTVWRQPRTRPRGVLDPASTGGCQRL